jgi:hypothetical protein
MSTTNETTKSDTLPCGCRLCGCACAEHSPARTETPCWRHGRIAWILGDAAALAAIGLFLACFAVWGAILADSLP